MTAGAGVAGRRVAATVGATVGATVAAIVGAAGDTAAGATVGTKFGDAVVGAFDACEVAAREGVVVERALVKVSCEVVAGVPQEIASAMQSEKTTRPITPPSLPTLDQARSSGESNG